jgi:hypothetical protein
MQAAGALFHDADAVMLAGIEIKGDALAVIFYRQHDQFILLMQVNPGLLGAGVAGAIGQRLAGDLQQMDLLAGGQADGKGSDSSSTGKPPRSENSRAVSSSA